MYEHNMFMYQLAELTGLVSSCSALRGGLWAGETQEDRSEAL